MAREKYKLLLVEDSDDDVVLFELALRRTGLHESFEIVRRFPNGEEAIEYFTLPLSVVDTDPRPEIVMLDLKMPGRSGFEVLAAMGKLKERPIVAVFTTSVLPEDKQKAQALGAELVQTKTFQSEEFSRFLNSLGRMAEERRGKKE